MKVNYLNLIRQLLPPHKRKPIRLAFLQSCITPLHELFLSFSEWRDNTRMMINVNCQVKVFESYLRNKYKEPIAIKVETYDDGLLLVGLEVEGMAMMPTVGLDHENLFAEIPLDGEIKDRFGDTDFIVYIPFTVDKSTIEAEIEKYKQALTRYKIIQN